ncbi:reticulon-1-A-like isoform X2 [Saccostrea echinata]|uniref:reticulon-1-A-like isoform X2 n=1 Tax=Saccostrea echinata TaxID=191078 RepID=UPI002A829B19|nr:reticulon-1-A-like isoform X2 [Saccostrea echinata]
MDLNSEHMEHKDASQEDFEKVDRIPEQDEEVTTTSFSGETVEADRYEPGYSLPAKTVAGNENTQNLLDLDDNEPFGQKSQTGFDSIPSNIEPLKPSAPPASGFDLLGESFENNPITSSSEKETPVKAPERKEAVSTPSEKKLPSEFDAWLKNVDPRVGQKSKLEEKDEGQAESKSSTGVTPNKVTLLELIYWCDVKKTGVVFGSMLFILLSLSCFSVLSVLAYLSLAVLTVTLSFRIYKNVLQAVQKSGEGHPFKQLLEMDIELPEDKARDAVVNILKHLNCTIRELRRLFLVEDLVDSIKFGLLLWVLTYVGSWFNGMTLIILAVVDIFTLPKVYETYKVQIDHYIDLARTQKDNLWKQVQDKVPFLKKKEKKQ